MNNKYNVSQIYKELLVKLKQNWIFDILINLFSSML